MGRYPDLVREAVKKGKFVILLLTYTFLAPHLVRAQQPSRTDSCYTFMVNVDLLYRENRAEFDVMTSIAAMARLGLQCYNYEPKTQTVYLLNNRANALEHLDRYEEVQALTDLFFERFFDAADEEHKGRWYMRALYLDLRAGRSEEASPAARSKLPLRIRSMAPLLRSAARWASGSASSYRRASW